MRKIANPEVEQGLSRLAYVQLQEKFPQLSEHLVGFQLVSTPDNKNKTHGVIILNIGGTHYGIPVIYRGGYMKPFIIIYDYSTKRLRALTEKMVAKLVTQQAPSGVEPIEHTQYSRMYSRPDISSILRYKGGSLVQRAIKTASKRAVRRMVDSFTHNLKIGEALLLARPDIVEMYKKASEKEVLPGPAKVNITIKTNLSPKNTTEENLQIMRELPVIKDRRKNFNSVYASDIASLTEAPGEQGFYKVLMPGGSFEDVYYTLAQEGEPIVYFMNSGRVAFIDPLSHPLFSTVPYQSKKKIFNKCLPLKQVKKDKTYLIMGRQQVYTCTVTQPLFNGRVETTLGTILVNPHILDVHANWDKRRIEVPSGVKLLPVIEVDRRGVRFGTLDDIFLKIPSVKSDPQPGGRFLVRDDDGWYSTGGILKVASALVCKHNLTFNDAVKVLKQEGRHFIKVSTIPEEYPEINTETDASYMPPERTAEEPVLNYHTEGITSSDEEIEAAIRMSEQGEDRPLDAELLGALAKEEGSSDRVKELIPILEEAIHGLGIQLHAMWWAPEDYIKDFDTDELYDLEQSVSTSFQKLQDIALTLANRKQLYTI